MNKYILIPHEQYKSFKSFLADKKEQKIAESRRETVDENKSDNHRDIHPKIDENNSEKSKREKFESVHSRIINNNNLDKKSDNLLDNNRKESVSTEFSVKTQNKAEVRHPLPPPGLPTAVNYSKDNYLSKIRKNERKIQKGVEPMNGFKNGPKNFNPPEEVDSYLYYDISSPVVYGSYSKLYPHIKREGKYHVSPKYLKKWLSKQETYTTFRPARRTFQRPKVLAFTKNYQWDSDMANMVKYKSDNNEYAYFAVFIDIFTRYLYTAPLKTLRGEEMVAVFQGIIRETDETPEILRTDQGSEYKNRPFNNLLNENKIKHLYTYYETKANYAERVIKTIKNKIMKYLSDKETLRWIDILFDLTYGYNNFIHRSIKLSPEDAKSRNQYLLWKSQYDNLNYPKSFISLKKQNKNPKLLRTLSNKKFKFNI